MDIKKHRFAAIYKSIPRLIWPENYRTKSGNARKWEVSLCRFGLTLALLDICHDQSQV
jgi:hypothetical protein